MFNDIFNSALSSRERNVRYYKEKTRIENEVKRKDDNERLLKNVVGYMNVDYKTDNCSLELLNLINKYNFQILSYEKNFDVREYDDDEPVEVYRCKKNNWTFDICHYSDFNIREGIFNITALKNVVTGKEVDFYCDLGCRATDELKLNVFLKLMNFNGEKQYIENEYKVFFDVPGLLCKMGVVCNIINENYTIKNAGFICEIDYSSSSLVREDDRKHRFYLKFEQNYTKDSELVIFENSNIDEMNMFVEFNIETKNRLKYRNHQDLNELVKCMDAFYEQINGRMGYEENGIYYSNNDIVEYLNSIINDKRIYDKTNHYLIRLDGYKGKYNCRANKYTGQEIFVSKNLVINDAGYWAEGEEINNSHITVEYNRNDDKDCCILTILNYIYKDADSYFEDIIDNDDYYLELNPIFLVGEVKIKGTYTYIMRCLDDYIKGMMKIYEIIE